LKILIAYGILVETISAIMMLHKNTRFLVRSPGGDILDFFDIKTKVLQNQILKCCSKETLTET